MKIIYVIILTFGLLLTMTILSCSEKKEAINTEGGREWEKEIIQSEKVDRSYISSHDEPIFGLFSDYFTNVKYIKLETTLESLVGVVSKLEVLNDGSFLIFDNFKGALYLFAPDGKFLRHIGHRGKAHNEYALPEQIAYDPYNDNIIVWDNAKKTLQYYDLDGEMIDSAKLPWDISTFDVVDKDHLCVYMNNGENLEKIKQGFNYKIIDHNGNVIKQFVPYGEELTDFNPASKTTLWRYGDTLYTMQPYSPLVSIVSSDTITPLYCIDFGKNAIPDDFISGSNRDFNEKIKKRPDLAYSIRPYMIGDTLYFNSIKARIVDFVSYDTKSGTSKYLRGLINDIAGLVSSNEIRKASNRQLYFVIDPQSFESFRDILSANQVGTNIGKYIGKEFSDKIPILGLGDKAQNEFLKNLGKRYSETNLMLTSTDWELINSIDESSNPIIQICTLK